MCKQKQLVVGANPNPRPQTITGVVSAPRMGKLSDKEFGETYYLFTMAMIHELGSKLTSYEGEFRTRTENRVGNARQTRLVEVHHMLVTLNRITSIHIATQKNAEVDTSILSIETKKRLGIDCKKAEWNLDIEAFKEIALANMQEHGALVKEVSGTLREICCQEFLPIISRTEKLSKILSDTVEKLILGNFDFEAELIKKPAWNTSILGKAANTTGCVLQSPEKLEDVEIFVNPVFQMLIASNIFANAKIAMAEKGLDNSPVRLNEFVRDGFAVYEFRDNGNGMSPEVMEKLNRGEIVSTKIEEGHGLGFWYCRELAEKMGGKLYVKESTVGVGTTVVLELRVADKISQ